MTCQRSLREYTRFFIRPFSIRISLYRFPGLVVALASITSRFPHPRFESAYRLFRPFLARRFTRAVFAPSVSPTPPFCPCPCRGFTVSVAACLPSAPGDTPRIVDYQAFTDGRRSVKPRISGDSAVFSDCRFEDCRTDGKGLFVRVLCRVPGAGADRAGPVPPVPDSGSGPPLGAVSGLRARRRVAVRRWLHGSILEPYSQLIFFCESYFLQNFLKFSSPKLKKIKFDRVSSIYSARKSPPVRKTHGRAHPHPGRIMSFDPPNFLSFKILKRQNSENAKSRSLKFSTSIF